MIRFQCPQCRGVLEAPESNSGEKFNCPACGQRLQIPPPDDPARKKTMLGALLSPFSSPQPQPASPPACAKPVPMPCPSCSTVVQVPLSLAGQAVRCPRCGATFRVKVKGKTPIPPPMVATVQPPMLSEPDAAIAGTSELAWVKRLLSLPWVILILIFGFLPWSEWNMRKVLQRDAIVPLLFSQSGYQALYGDHNSPLDLLKKDNPVGWITNLHRSFRYANLLLVCSPFMTLFWTAALAMLACVWWTPLSANRLKTFLAFVGLMLAMLLITLIWGMPLELNANKQMEEVFKEDPQSGLIMNVANTRGKTVWFWLTFTAVLLVGVTEAASNLMWKTRDYVSPIPFIGIRIAAAILAGAGAGLQIILWRMAMETPAERSSGVWWALELTVLAVSVVLAGGGIWLYQLRSGNSGNWITALTKPGDREFLREAVQLFLFALAVSVIGGAFADFFARKAPLNLIFAAGLAAAALLCLLLFPFFRRQGLGLAAFCLLCVAMGFGVWWGLAEITDSRDRGVLASLSSTIRDWQEQVFHARPDSPNTNGGGNETAKTPGTPKATKGDAPKPRANAPKS